MNAFDGLHVSEHGARLDVVFDRPDKLNAISDAMLQGLRAALDHFAAQAHLRVLLLRARGRYFSAGAEISPALSPAAGTGGIDGRAWYRHKWHRLFDDFEAVEKPIVVAHQGPCLGGALELSLSCDFRLAARSARYGLPEIELGALPGSGGISRLVRLVGPHWARWIAMAGRPVDAAQAQQIGLVHETFADDELDREAEAFCRHLEGLSPEALGLAKLSIELAADLDRTQARNVERIANSLLFTSADHKERLAAFLARQAARRRRREGSDGSDGSGQAA
ncbi:MAG: enoyl-CoA hydratase/isomerase family protein [Proteobacteria bacterium]|nr:enoyl-CoA hydratase/isomerase family protein [Pseudomonadota bacterium]